MPAAGTWLAVAHGIANMAHVINCVTIADNESNPNPAAHNIFVLPFVDPSGPNDVAMYLDETNIYMMCGGTFDRTDNDWVYVTIQYVCTDR